VFENNIAIADEIWKDLVEVSSVEPPLLINHFMMNSEERRGRGNESFC
jgi:hypothetical protein